MKRRFSRKEFLDALFSDYFRERGGFIMVRSERTLDHKTSTRYFPNVEILAKEAYAEDQNVFFGVAPRENMRPDKTHVRYVTALWAGLDLGPEGYSGSDNFFNGPALAAKAVRSFPLPPSIIVESGWGMHLYWLLDGIMTVTDVDWVERQLARINDYFQCKSDVPIDSVLRLPETYNCKISEGSTACEIKYLNPEFRYAPSDFEDLDLPGERTLDVERGSRGKAPEESQVENALTGDRADAGGQSRINDASGATSEFTRREPAKRRSSLGTRATANHVTPRIPVTSAPLPEADLLDDFEPVPYEPETTLPKPPTQVHQQPTELPLADQIADKVVEKLSDKLVNELVDQIVEKLARRLSGA